MCKEMCGAVKKRFLPQHFAAVIWIICQVRGEEDKDRKQRAGGGRPIAKLARY